ncbi:glycosyltransferase [Pseudomonas abieticivorans]|uniref:glycosyltransferase n=1 Tax=Pseudomonas abieticivorans TaxID=2931382 RepID=UPI0020BE5362|nr:glycosyltransferase [Pseudomonas sp. PIA16]
MKVMLLVMDEQRVILDHLYEVLQQHCGQCDIYRLSKAQQKNLGRFFRANDYQAYDRVVVFARLKWLMDQVSLLKCIPGLVFVEHDACQNYMQFSKYQGKYTSFYRQLPSARVLCSGAVVARRLREDGIDAVFVSKGYDEQMLQNLHGPRDVPLGFIGSLKGVAYTERLQMLNGIAKSTSLAITRTKSGNPYRDAINRIQIFVSADTGMGEYMIKNFEAMACGCMLVTTDQGQEEVSQLGFQDMVNVVLYRTVDEAVAKIKVLQADPALIQRIAQAGQALAEERYSFSVVGKQLAQSVSLPVRPRPALSLLQRLWVRLRYQLAVK